MGVTRDIAPIYPEVVSSYPSGRAAVTAGERSRTHASALDALLSHLQETRVRCEIGPITTNSIAKEGRSHGCDLIKKKNHAADALSPRHRTLQT